MSAHPPHAFNVFEVERITDQELRENFSGTISDVVEMYQLRKSEKA